MNRWRPRILVLLAITSIYLYGYPSATLTYSAVLLFHLVAGLVLTVSMVPYFASCWREQKFANRLGWSLLALGAILGIVLIKVGTPHRLKQWLYAHIALCVAGVFFLALSWAGSRKWFGVGAGAPVLRFATVLILFAVVSAGAWWTRSIAWKNAYRIKNPPLSTETMDGEGDGPGGKFFPSSAQTRDGKNIPAKYFMQSQACERCHKDVYKQWYSSAHHFSSFNNQWYRKSIEYMQEVVGARPSKWCGGCHDPSVLYSGMMDTPIKQIVHTPEANAGLGCLMCHSITKVKSTMGQGDFVLLYPKLHELAASKNPVMRWLHDYSVYVNPEPHRRAFFKPFMHNEQSAEFCSSCHKVHLDVPVNNYRWIRGFNDYDNWQASGVSGLGARSFYYPPEPKKCMDCHMPMLPSHDAGNINGKVHSHRFPGANTAIPFVNHDAEQLDAVTKFLQDKILSVDIFAISRARTEDAPKAGSLSPELSTTFAVGE